MAAVTPVSFEGARHIVAAATGLPIARYGWHNDTLYVLAVEYPDGGVPKGEEIPTVVKATGQLRWELSARGEPVAPGLQPIGVPPA